LTVLTKKVMIGLIGVLLEEAQLPSKLPANSLEQLPPVHHVAGRLMMHFTWYLLTHTAGMWHDFATSKGSGGVTHDR